MRALSGLVAPRLPVTTIRGMKRWIVRIAIGLAVLFVAIQFVPSGRTNPAVTKPLDAPADVMAILRRSCFDCHSNETQWPWYAYVAPTSWLVVHDTDEGRAELNFSHWGDMTPKARSSKASEVVEEIEGGEMPLEEYLWMHSDAKISESDLEVLRRWSDGDV
mgnify:CR=1 FL=1